MEHQDVHKIAAFFNALKYSSYIFDKSSDKNVILIPDNFDAHLQEKLLRSCALPRESTFLLWRSVATCLGNTLLVEQFLGSDWKLKIIDYQLSYCDVSILSIVREGGLIVPQRRAYQHSGIDFPLHVPYKGQDEFLPSNKFYRCTYYGSTEGCVVWDDAKREFERKNFVKERKIQLYIGLQGRRMKINHYSVSDGGAIYVARMISGRPTYYDECTGLYIVVQDLDKEEIYSKELIAPNSKCRGGDVINGMVNTDCFIEKGANNVRFRLADAYGNDVPLKVLDYNFKVGAMKKREPLKLYPSMVPGQGIARVRVTGEMQIREPVELDLLEMKLAKPIETVKSLREAINHSYPIDMPAVAADAKLWQKVQGAVIRYLQDKGKRSSKMFAKCRYANPKATEVEKRLNRINVFGFAEGRELPVSAESFNFEGLFNYLAEDYKYCCKREDAASANDVLAMISRTYKGRNPAFAPIKRDILKQVAECSQDDKKSISSHKMTACANLLCDSGELMFFFQSYLRKLDRVTLGCDVINMLSLLRSSGQLDSPISIPDFKGLNNWHRALSELLMANRDMLKGICTETCNKLIKNLLILLASHYNYSKHKLICSVLKVFLFLLTRRKYDKSFLQERSQLRTIAEGMLEKVKHSTDETVNAWSDIVLKYVQGKGTLDGLIMVAEENGNDEQ